MAYFPEDGSTVTELSKITMQFDDPMRIISVAMTCDGEDTALSRETGTDPVTEFVASPGAALMPGDYMVEWRGMSSDGHPMTGSFTFTLTE
ncbi:copper resistance CopC family protein [Roseivivax sp. THAF40]|uniref:copper resistance CopC family protein n=1 Tax=Roseivivax sp. THAF40 TaxID=2587858 RepID=UPI001562B174|nr:copper resistance CopC family protein [Roseivivax sp. THAF40]